MKRLLLWLAFLVAMGSLSAAQFRLEADHFVSQKGKWQIGQAVKNTGNQYLVAMEKGCTLNDTFSAPETGTYTVYAYTTSRSEGWRICTVSVNGKELGSFGDARDQKDWYIAKLPQTIALTAGQNFSVKIVSPRGMGRVDFLVFSSDPEFQIGEARPAWEQIPALKSCAPIPPEKLIPPAVGKGEPILLLHGGRPWTANDTQTFLVAAGASVTNLNSVWLDGQGGASIKRFLTDKVEPKAKDGLTPAMQCLKKFKAVFVTAIPQKNQAAIFTPERVQALRKYVERGGCLMVNCFCPDKALADLMPVRFESGLLPPPENWNVQRPDRPAFQVIPKEWRLFTRYRKVSLTEGAEVLFPIQDETGTEVGVFAAVKSFGKGKVLYLNADWARQTGMCQIYSWAYGKALMTSLLADLADLNLHPEKTIYPIPDPPAHKQHDSLEIAVKEPILQLTEFSEQASVEDRSFVLENGIRAVIKENGNLDFYWPGVSIPYIRDMEPPTLILSSALADVDAGTAELKGGALGGEKILSGNWKFLSVKPQKDGVVLRYANGEIELDWKFTCGTLNLEGVVYQAFAEEPFIVKCPHLIQSVRVQSRLALGENTANHRVRRLSCYSPPRGYAEYDFSGVRNVNTSAWSLFGSGQPFTWVTAPAGIYSEFPDDSVVSEPRLWIQAGETSLTQTMRRQFGYRAAPVGVPKVWHAFTPHAETGNNEWMTMYQFIRLRLREKAGLPSLPPLPTSTWQNVCSPQEVEESVRVASELGFRRAHIPLCPSPIESLRNLGPRCQMIRKYGMIPFAWSAGDYAHGDNERIYLEHKDWFLRDAAGKIHFYGGPTGHPVLDLNNKDFQKWYFETLDIAIANGLGAIYFDMYGTAVGNINYAKKDSPSCLNGGMEIFKYLLDRGVSIGVEGQNPLVQDNWWYRQDKYTAPFQGKEFSILCSSPSSGTCGDDLALDYFRTSMYCTFLYVNTDGYPKRFERTPGENAKIERMGRLNPFINRAIEAVQYPFIRETPFGTSWYGENGGALFFYDGAQDVTVDLPCGWVIEGIEGNVLRDVPPESIFILKKM